MEVEDWLYTDGEAEKAPVFRCAAGCTPLQHPQPAFAIPMGVCRDRLQSCQSWVNIFQILDIQGLCLPLRPWDGSSWLSRPPQHPEHFRFSVKERVSTTLTGF